MGLPNSVPKYGRWRQKTGTKTVLASLPHSLALGSRHLSTLHLSSLHRRPGEKIEDELHSMGYLVLPLTYAASGTRYPLELSTVPTKKKCAKCQDSLSPGDETYGYKSYYHVCRKCYEDHLASARTRPAAPISFSRRSFAADPEHGGMLYLAAACTTPPRHGHEPDAEPSV